MVVSFDPPLPGKDKDAYLKEVQFFLESDKVTRVNIDSGRAFHAARVDMREPGKLTNDLKERIQLAKDAQDNLRILAERYPPGFGRAAKIDKEFRLNKMQLALILFGDLDALKENLPMLGGTDLLQVRVATGILAAEAFLGICTSGTRSSLPLIQHAICSHELRKMLTFEVRA